jgi:ribosome maturation factor RimP
MELKLANGTVCRTQTENRIYDLIVNTLHSLEFVIVKIRLFRSGAKHVLQIMLEKNNGESVTLNDCESATKCISVILDTNDTIIDDAYNLEISSTGINRPITRPEEFQRFIGTKVRVKTLTKIDDSSVFFGILTKADGHTIVIDNQEAQSSIVIEVANVVDANLDLEPRRSDDRPPRSNFDSRKKPSNSKFGDRRPSGPRSGGSRFSSDGDRRPRRDGEEGARPSYNDRRPSGPRSGGSRFSSDGDRRPRRDGEEGARPSYNDRRPSGPRSGGSRFSSGGDRRPRRDGEEGARPSYNDRRPSGPRSGGSRFSSGGDRRPRRDGEDKS